MGDVPLTSTSPQAAPLARTAALPPLDPGAYRLVRTGPLGTQVGSFWVLGPPEGSATTTTSSIVARPPATAAPPTDVGSPPGTEPGTTSVTVIVATGAIPRGTSGEDAIAQGLVGTKQIPASVAPPTAVHTVDALANKASIFGIEPDTVIVEGMFVMPPDA